MVSPSQAAQARRKTESRMTDRCVVERITVDKTAGINETTGQYPTVVQQVYPPASDHAPDGPCLLKAANTAVGEIDAAGQQLVEQSAQLQLPVLSSVDVQKNDVARITASQNDPQMVGVHVRIEGPHRQTSASSRRFAVEETT
jgi:hypothetical protein